MFYLETFAGTCGKLIDLQDSNGHLKCSNCHLFFKLRKAKGLVVKSRYTSPICGSISNQFLFWHLYGQFINIIAVCCAGIVPDLRRKYHKWILILISALPSVEPVSPVISPCPLFSYCTVLQLQLYLDDGGY